MDDKLRKRLEKIETQIEVLYRAEEAYLTLESAREHNLAQIVATVHGNSQAAKDSAAKATKEWFEIRSAIAIAEAEFHRQKHILELKNNAFQAEYLSLKIEAPAISKQGSAE